MPFYIDFEPRGAYVRLFGVCTYDDVLQATIMLWEHPSFDSMKYEIFDYLDVTEIEFSDYEVVELAVRDDAASKMSRRDKMAVVATHPDILALSEKYREIHKDSAFEFMVTDTVAAARTWVGQ